MLPPSLTRPQWASPHSSLPSSHRSSTPHNTPSLASLQQFYGAGQVDVLLQPRSHLYGVVGRTPTPRQESSNTSTPLHIPVRKAEPIDHTPRRPKRLATPSAYVSNSDNSSENNPIMQEKKAPVTRRLRDRPKAPVETKTQKKAVAKTTPKKRAASKTAAGKAKVMKKDDNDGTAGKDAAKKPNGTMMTRSAVSIGDDSDEDDIPLKERCSSTVQTASPNRHKSILDCGNDGAAPIPSLVRPAQVLQNGWTFDGLAESNSGTLPSARDDWGPVSAHIQRNPELERQVEQCKAEIEELTKRAHTDEKELARTKLVHDEEMHKLRLVHEAEQQKTKKLLQEAQASAHQYQQAERQHIEVTAQVNEQLALTQAERGRLQATVDDMKQSIICLEAERVELQEGLEAQKNKAMSTNAALEKEIVTLKETLRKEQEAHRDTLQQLNARATKSSPPSPPVTATPTSEISALEAQNAALKQELEVLKCRASTPALMSPAPTLLSSSTTPEDPRDRNIRMTYLKVKRRYDSLHSVARGLVRSTKGIDLSSFGEFGSNLRQLRAGIEEGEGG